MKISMELFKTIIIDKIDVMHEQYKKTNRKNEIFTIIRFRLYYQRLQIMICLFLLRLRFRERELERYLKQHL